MRKYVAVSALVLALGALFCFAMPVRADKAILSIIFQKAGQATTRDGASKGPKAIRGIECTRVTFPGDPTKTQKGSRMGRQNKTFTIVKEIDSASPKLMQACSQGRTFSATIVYTQATNADTTGAAGAGEERPYLTITLTNAVIQKISDAPKSAGGNEQEQIRFTYQKISYTYTKGGKSFQDDWEAPV